MNEKYKAVAYWGMRSECIEQCAERLARFLHELEQISPRLARWYQLGATKKDAIKALVRRDLQNLCAMAHTSAGHRAGSGKPYLDDMGVSFGMWTGEQQDGSSMAMNIVCGSSNQYAGVNHVRMNPPRAWLDVDQAVALVRAMVACWSPSTAMVCSGPALTAMADAGIDEPVIDWVFYHRLPRAGALSPPSRVAFELDGGECIVVQDTPAQPGDPDARARVLALSRQLGLMRGQS